MAGPILVAGGGAVGGYIAAHLARQGEDVAVLEPWQPQREAMAAHGLRIEEPDDSFTVKLPVFARASDLSMPPRLIILCPKLPDATAMVAGLEAAFRAPYLVTLNALADLTLAERLGAARVTGCIATGLFATLAEPGLVKRHRRRFDGGPASFRLGETHGAASPRLAAQAELLGRIDTTEMVDDLPAARWTKMVFNAMTSGLVALHGGRLRPVFEDHALRAHALALALEVVAVGKAEGIRFGTICGMEGALWQAGAEAKLNAGIARYASHLDPQVTSGMAQDLAQGRRTEVREINGEVVRRAARHGIHAPENQALVAALEAAGG